MEDMNGTNSEPAKIYTKVVRVNRTTSTIFFNLNLTDNPRNYDVCIASLNKKKFLYCNVLYSSWN